MQVLITGGTSFLGNELIKLLIINKHPVIALTRNKKLYKKNLESIEWSLNQIPKLKNVNKIDIAIHLAHDYSIKNNHTINGTIKLINYLKSKGIKKQIYISSISACQKNSKSSYANIKKTIETKIKRKNIIIIRPGLIVGNGGIYKKLSDLISNFKIIPIPNIENLYVKTIRLKTLCQLILKIIKSKNNGVYNLIESQVLFEELIRNIGNKKKKKIFIFKISTFFIDTIFKLLKYTCFKKIISTDNIFGLLENSKLKIKSHIHEV